MIRLAASFSATDLQGPSLDEVAMTFFQTSIEFRPTLQAQHDDAKANGQDHGADLFDQLLTGLTEGEAS